MNINFAVYDNKHNQKIEIINDINKHVETIVEFLKMNNLDKAMKELRVLTNDYPINSELECVIHIIQEELINKQIKKQDIKVSVLNTLDITCLIIRESLGDEFMSGYERINDTITIYDNYDHC